MSNKQTKFRLELFHWFKIHLFILTKERLAISPVKLRRRNLVKTIYISLKKNFFQIIPGGREANFEPICLNLGIGFLPPTFRLEPPAKDAVLLDGVSQGEGGPPKDDQSVGVLHTSNTSMIH